MAPYSRASYLRECSELSEAREDFGAFEAAGDGQWARDAATATLRRIRGRIFFSGLVASLVRPPGLSRSTNRRAQAHRPAPEYERGRGAHVRFGRRSSIREG